MGESRTAYANGLVQHGWTAVGLVLALVAGLAVHATPVQAHPAAEHEAPELAEVTVGENRPVAPVEPLTDDNAPGRNAGGIAVNPEDPDHLVAFTWDAHAPAGETCEFHVSRDGGATWTTTHFEAPAGFGTEPEGQRGFCSQERGSTRHSSRGEIEFAGDDTVYTAFLSVREGRQGTSVLVARSTDGGNTFETPMEAIEGGVTGTVTDGIVNPQHPAHNFPRLAVDPGAGVGGADRIYASGLGSTVDHATNTWSERNVSIAVSNDGGETWSDAVAVNRADQTVTDDPATFNADLHGDIVIGSDGTAYTTWEAGDLDKRIALGWSEDGGQTWQTTDVVDIPGDDPYPRLAIDPNTDDLYLVYALEPAPAAASLGDVRAMDHWFHSGARVYLTKSTDGGQNWSGSVQVNDEAPVADGNRFHQIRHPNVAVSPSGRVDVVWFDRRHWIEGRTPVVERGGADRTENVPDRDFCEDSHWSCSEARISDIYHAFSTDGGTSFSTDVRVTDISSNDDVGWEFQQGSFWHHGLTLDHAGDDMVTAWADSRRSKALPGWFEFAFAPGPTSFRARENEDLFFAKVSYDDGGAPRVETLPADSAPDLSATLSEEVGYPGGVQGRGTDRVGPVMATSPFSQAVVVNDDDWASALVGSVLARRFMGPVLATPAGALPASVDAEIDRMELYRREEAPRPLPEGTDTSDMVDQADLTGVFILGGTDEVSAAVQTDIEGRDIDVERLSQGHVEMAAEVARQLDDRLEEEVVAGDPAFAGVVIVNPNDSDSAAASVLAANRRLPVLFVEAGAIPAATQDALDDLDIDQTLVVGDTDAVSDTVLGNLPSAQRVSGADAFETSAALAHESRHRGLPANMLYVVDGDPMNAALAGSPVARAGGLLLQEPAASAGAAMATMEDLGLDEYVDEIVRFGEPLGDACDDALVPDSPFTDIAGNVHADNIACIVWYGLTQGTTPTTYSPTTPVTRDQMASFIARLMERAGVTFDAASDQGFTDIAGNVHADRINQLAAAGVVLGTSATTYAPRQEVRRDQMASFLVRAYEVINDGELERQATTFTDVAGNTHLENIEKAATAGFTQGTTATTYAPAASVRRDQMGSFLARVLQRGMADGHVLHPAD